jgi:hypothetical protein
MKCIVCKTEDMDVVFSASGHKSITSLSKIVEGDTEVFFCRHCTHLQTKKINNLSLYYGQEYNILINSEEEDQLYVAKDGTTSFRLEYQKILFDQKIALSPNAKVLDYGCAKASTLKLITKDRHDVIPLCYDVSDAYTPFWYQFVAPEYCFANRPVDPSLNGRIDCVTSFFSLEHTDSPIDFMYDIVRLLAYKGQLLCIIPNVFTNWADLVVVDHINHFTKLSIQELFTRVGLRVIDIDEEIYNGAYVITAIKDTPCALQDFDHDSLKQRISIQVSEIAQYWSRFSERVADIERGLTEDAFMVYGAGFYSAFLRVLMKKRPKCYIDMNKYLQGSFFFEKPVVGLADADTSISDIVVGLNPLNARAIIEKDVKPKFSSQNFLYLDS